MNQEHSSLQNEINEMNTTIAVLVKERDKFLREIMKLKSLCNTQKVAIICTATSLRKNYPEDTYLAGIASLLDSTVKEIEE